MYDILNMAKIAADVYNDVSESDMLRDWHTNQIQDLHECKKDNFLARAYWRGSRNRIACVCFRGTDDLQDALVEDLGGIGLGLNALAMKLNDAVEFTASVAARAEITWLTGHSLGGAYVQLVGAILGLPGISWNAPGALALVNQLSSNPIRSAVGGIGSAGMGVLASLPTAGLGGLAVSLMNKLAALGGDEAFAPIANYRGNWDPVSLVGTHVGVPLETIVCPTQSPHVHSMIPIIRALELR
ncbi:hypothetical protein GXW74_09420 [Roseomonas eburnea]|uniref:Fungal lipase-like domain-containing protein n=1 Tax=Neoroseomonas eburnea TaxID=1346889 RepID=A0A9X9XAH1_9PROT|nr:hypothetical protein [Neoroseomonas eburnea]MBR0680707.1 hypothetical protein [Neoroseomonas eburnea]